MRRPEVFPAVARRVKSEQGCCPTTWSGLAVQLIEMGLGEPFKLGVGHHPEELAVSG